MIFFADVNSTFSGEPRVLPVPFLFANSSTNKLDDPETSWFCPSTKLLSIDTVQRFVAAKGYNILLTVADGVNVPIPVTLTEGYDLTHIYNYIGKLLDKSSEPTLDMATREDIKAKTGSKFTAIGDPSYILDNVISGCIALRQYLKSSSIREPITLGKHLYDPYCYYEVNSMVSELNDSMISPFKSIKMSDNQTLFQEKCTDKLFIKLPLPTDLMGTDLGYETFIPDMNKVCIPYTNPVAYTEEYNLAGQVTPNELLTIEGTQKNSYADFYDNELDYYNALCEWIKYNSENYFNKVVPEENVIVDPDTERYLERLIEKMYHRHWAHSPHVPTILDDVPDNSDDSEGSEVVSDFVSGRYFFETAVNGEHKDYKNGAIAITDYIKRVSNALGYKVYAEAIIKLSRWGERKPKMLYINGYDTMFDLSEVKIVPHIGSIEDYVVEKVYDCDYMVVSTIYDDVKVSAKIDGRSVEHFSFPIGVILSQKLVNSVDTDKEPVRLNYYVPIVDLIRRLKDGEKIYRLEYANNKLSAQLDLLYEDRSLISVLTEQYVDNSNYFYANPFYRSNELQSLCLMFNTTKSNEEVPMNHFSIMSGKVQNPKIEENIETYKFSSLEEFKDKVSRWVIINKGAALEYNIFSVYSKLYGKMIDKVAENSEIVYDVNEAILAWDACITEIGYLSENDFLKDNINPSNSVLKASSAFSSNNNNTEEYDVDMISKINKEDGEIFILYSANSAPIGLVQIKTKSVRGTSAKCYVLCSAESAKQDGITFTQQKAVSIVGLLPFILGALSNIQDRESDKILIAFHDRDSITAITKSCTAKV